VSEPTDSERLDWLENKNKCWSWKIDTDCGDADVVLVGANGHDTLRQAIDAAMDAEEAPDE
jgi:hypothetical protein